MSSSAKPFKRIGRFLGEVPEQHKSLSFYPDADNGPYTTASEQDRLTVSGRDGSQLTIDAYTFVDPRVDKEQLAQGVGIWLDGVLIGHLVQSSRGISRKSRAMHIRPAQDSDVLPEGHYFRLRGNLAVCLESPSGTVLRERTGRSLRTIKLGTNKTSNPALIALHVAVRSGFNEPLRLSPVWKPKED